MKTYCKKIVFFIEDYFQFIYYNYLIDDEEIVFIDQDWRSRLRSSATLAIAKHSYIC